MMAMKWRDVDPLTTKCFHLPAGRVIFAAAANLS